MMDSPFVRRVAIALGLRPRRISRNAPIELAHTMLFSSPPLQLAPDVWLLSGFTSGEDMLAEIEVVAAQAGFRHYVVPGGKSMSVAMTSCGQLGWVSDASGYAYLQHDPQTHRAWPMMPATFLQLAQEAARVAGWQGFDPDSCLINRYEAGAGMGLHQDRNEKDLRAPIVSVSIGAAAKFMLGGLQRSDRVQSFDLHDGDVMVWGGRSRLVFHGVRPLLTFPEDSMQLRYNLTFRQAGLKAT
jgi:DNA oxidative demethylase